MTVIVTRAPGKLFVAGEYAVLQPGEPAVLVAVDRFLTVRLSAAATDAGSGESGGTAGGGITSREYGAEPRRWRLVPGGEGPGGGATRATAVGALPTPGGRDFVAAAMSAVEQLRAERGRPERSYDLEIESELADPGGRKYGLGSSAAATVAVVAALDRLHELGLSRAERFRLALLATIAVSPDASGGDVAASATGGWIRYSAPDRAALAALRRAAGIGATLAAPWPGLAIEPLPDPSALQLLVGWTGSPATTDRLVATLRDGRPDGPGGPANAATGPGRASRDARPGARGLPVAMLAESRACVDALLGGLAAAALPAGPSDAPGAPTALDALAAVRRARALLQRLGANGGVTIETARLGTLCDIAERHGAAAKPSGAGGGDCGIALPPPGSAPEGILREWDTHGIEPLDVAVHPWEGGADEC